MIEGVGIDVVDVSRIEKAMTRPGFVSRILTKAEREVITTPARVAGRWAAKEAVAKALGIDLGWHDVEILPDASGAPIAKARQGSDGCRIHLSITHERGHAAAVAIVERIAPTSTSTADR